MQAIFLKNTVISKHPYNSRMQRGRTPKKEAPFFGRQLAYFRKKKGLTQYEFAEQLQISRNLVVHYERSCENPTMDFVLRAAKLLGISLDELMGLKPEKEKPGPSSKAIKLAERISKMPRNKQSIILSMLEGAIDKAS